MVAGAETDVCVLSTISIDELGRIWVRGNCIEARFVLPGHDWPLRGLHDLALMAPPIRQAGRASSSAGSKGKREEWNPLMQI
jgi:hypothetical protein